MGLMTRIADKTGALGSVVSAMGCAACFPALASFGAAIGLGFLSQYEGLFISRLLPLFAALAFLANALGWFSHRQWLRSLLGMIGPAIVLWNTVYLERAAHALRGNGHAVDDSLLQYLSPLGWEHINLTGDYLWRSSAKIGAGKFRPLRPLQPA
ncbi:organomercurial transporter MerC [Klebsiella pneumoniae]|uniref:organomercurial transporter MerC n=1 Tax=Klebsiella pneumoniae TaxID=573 RepID=UPI002DBEF58E|nr:organomercurial transporter MerC [Klebsiella pneumoniae]MEC4361686.1 organomercurial transporter MerC [Klebsiella pneumoniae]